MNTWIGPALIAAVISSLVTAIGWLVNYRTSLGLEKERRLEKVRDFQIALRAEVRSELPHLREVDFAANFAKIETRYSERKDYSVLVTSMVPHVVFDTLVKEIYLLPEPVIDPVILYARQRQIVDQFASDMRLDSFRHTSQAHQLEMYKNYLDLMTHMRRLAQEALAALETGLGKKREISSPAAGP
jgi:hypothetical protein